MEKKKVMILGANNFLMPLIKKSKELGLYTIVVSPVKEEPGFAYADQCLYIDVRDKESILKEALALHIDGITTDQAETSVPVAAYVAEKLNLPGIGTDMAKLFTNKFLMRERCREIGIDTIQYKLVKTKREAIDFYHSMQSTMIMKPIDSAGSRGVVRINGVEDIEEGFEYTQNASRSGNVIIEEYIEGKELLIDGVTFDHHYQTLTCGEYRKCKAPGVFSEYLGKYPAEVSEEQYERVKEFVKKVIEGFGLPWGRTHTEVKINNSGIYLMETAARGGGRYISSGIVPMMTDFSSEEFLLRRCIGEISHVPVVNYKNVSCGYVSMFIPVGEIVSAEGIQEVIDLPYTFSHNFENICVGMKTLPFMDKIEGKFIHILAENDKDFYEKVEEVKSIIKLKVKTPTGIEGPVWEG